MDWKMILDRFKEPSTYAGLAAVLAFFLPGTEDQWVALLGGLLAFVFAAMAIFMPEKTGNE